MKKLLIILVVNSALALSATKATAQDHLVARNNKVPAAIESSGTGSPTHPAAVSDRVNKKFTKQFAGATDASWIKSDDGFVVWFTSNGIQSRAFLTKRGAYQGSIRYYTEGKLPAAIRHLVKQKYYDFAITSVREVQDTRATAYLVTIADESTWKVIRVLENEMDVWEEHVKG